MTQMSIDQAFEWARHQHLAGRLAQAEQVYRQILQQHPNHAPSLHYLGVIGFQMHRVDDALILLRRALAINPRVPDFHHNLGLALQEMGKLDEALAEFRAALQLNPSFASSRNSMATVLSAMGNHDEAVKEFHLALQYKPDDGMIYNNLGITETSRGHFAAAERALRRAAELLPGVGTVYSSLGNLLLWSGRIDDAIAAYRRTIELMPERAAMWSNLLMTLHYHPTISPQQILREHQLWAEKVAAPLTAAAPPFDNDRSPDRRLRIAYVSVDFREHPIAYFIEPILRHHDRRNFEVFCYADLPRPDDVTERLSRLVDHWRPFLISDDDDRVARRIREDKIDILIDLGAHTAYNRLLAFARRAAQVQITYLGYGATTGLPAIDWRITDTIIDPAGSEAHGTEKLIRLDRTFCVYQPPAQTPDVAPLPATSAGHITFGSLSTVAKITDPVIALWAKVLLAVAGSRLLMRARGIDDEMQARLRTSFARHGVAPNRLELLNHAPVPEYFQTFGQVDIELDPFPYSAHTTTCHALWMGVPVVTLTGQRSVSRVSASVLTSVGLSEFIAMSEDEYIKIAVAATTDLPRLVELRATMRDRLRASPLLDGQNIARRLETEYRKAWRTWAQASMEPAQAAPDLPEPRDAGDFVAALARGDALLAAGKADDAERVLSAAARRWPERVEAHHNLSMALMAQGKYPEAIESARRAIALNPAIPEPYISLANTLQTSGNAEEAVSVYEQALRLQPDDADSHNNLGGALVALGRFTRAAGAYRRAAQLRPDHVLALTNLGNVLQSVGRQREGIEAYEAANRARPNFSGAASNRLYALHHLDDVDPRTVFQEHLNWARSYAASIPRFRDHQNDRNPARRLRVGFVSPDLHQHPVGRFILPLVQHLDRAQVELYFYADGGKSDSLTAELRSAAAQWRTIFGRTDDEAAAMIRQDRIDILIDLAGHTARPRLLVFARKPAPVQATYLGYPDTTGLSAIDWRITDAIADPPGEADALHTERLMRLAGCAWNFGFPINAPAVEAPPATRNSFLTFGSFNNFAKVSPTAMRLWAKVLEAVPGSRLLIKSSGLDEPQTAEHVYRQFAQHGVARDRLQLLGRTKSFKDHLCAYASIDIALDTFPYHGTTTTCEALWMGVPVITLAGQVHVSRVGASLLSAAGLEEQVAKTGEEYVAIAQRLSGDVSRLASMRSTLRERLRTSPLCDGPAFARRFEAGLREMWRAWVTG